jgi:hypothetical protein
MGNVADGLEAAGDFAQRVFGQDGVHYLLLRGQIRGREEGVTNDNPKSRNLVLECMVSRLPSRP